MTLANFPTTRPAFTANFARSQQMPPQVTFSRASTGTYVGENELVQTAANDTSRFNWGDGKCQGLLVEQSRTNIIQNSLITSTNGWQAGTTLTPNNALAPDGTNTATTCLPASGATQTITSPLRIVPTANAFTFSTFVKPTSVFTHFRLAVVNYSDTANQSVIFDTTKTGIDGDGITPNFQNTSNYLGATMDKSYGNGWVRLSLTVNFVGPDLNGVMQLSNVSPSVGDGVNSFPVWQGQLEEGTFPTSLIPTSGAAATRAQDLVTISGTEFSSWWNSSEGSIVTVVDNFPTNDGGRYVWEFNANTHVPTGPVLKNGTNTNFQSPVNGDYTDSTINFADLKIKTAFAFTTNNDIAGSGDGSTTQTNTSGLDPTTSLVTIGRGRGSGTTGVLNGTIASIFYYPTRVSNDALEALTQ